MKGTAKICIFLLAAIAGNFLLTEPAGAATNVNACQSLNIANEVYTLTANVSSGGTCFTIGANNVTLNGNGYTVNYSQSSTGYGVDNSGGYDNMTIKRLNIVQGSTNLNSHAIEGGDMANSTVTNNSIITTLGSSGIYLSSDRSNTFSNNNITTLGDLSYGISSLGSNSDTFSNNIITTSSSYGIFLFVSNSNTLSNNNITTSSSEGIDLDSSSSNTLMNNNITTNGTNGYGIYLYSSSNSNTLSGNSITTSGSSGYGIYLDTSSTNTLSNNNITTSNLNGYGILLSSSSTNTLSGNTVSTNGTNGFGIYLYSSSNSNTLSNNTVTTSSTSGWGIYIFSSNTNSITGGSIVSRNSYDYYFRNAEATNNFTNTNLTALRQIYFWDKLSWFNYRNDSSQNIWLKTNVSAASSLNRTLASWNNTLMKWNDTNSTAGITASYNLTGLRANTVYTVANSSKSGSYSQNMRTDAGGSLPGFRIFLNGNTEISVSTSPPKWSANATSPASPQVYNAANNFGFQINWTDADGDFANATFQLGRPSGALANYTKCGSGICANNNSVAGPNVWYINLTQNQLGHAGTYNYTWFGIDTTGFQNSSQAIGYTIGKAPTLARLFLNGAEGNMNYNLTQTANFTVLLNISGTASLGTNISGWSIASGASPLYNYTQLQRPGIFNITGYFAGDENYSASSVTYFANVTFGIANITVSLALRLGPLFADDSLQNGNNYACVQDGSGWLGLTSESPAGAQSGNLSSDYSINVSFTSGNKAFLATGKDSCANFRRYAGEAQLKRFLSPLMAFSYAKTSLIQLILQFNATDITNDAHWGKGSYLLSIANGGYSSSSGKQNLAVKTVR